MTSVSSLISLLCFCFVDLCIGVSGVLNYPISVWGLMCNLSFIINSVSFTLCGCSFWGQRCSSCFFIDFSRDESEFSISFD